jgi:hypothetical protein
VNGNVCGTVNGTVCGTVNGTMYGTVNGTVYGTVNADRTKYSDTSANEDNSFRNHIR